MKLKHFEDINQYYEYVKPYLIQQEGYHNLLFGALSRLRNQAEPLTHPYLVTVEEDENLVAVAIKTKPRKLILSKSLNLKAFNVIAQNLHAREEIISVVVGLVDEAQAFAQAWQAVTDQSYRQGMQLGIYQLTTVNSVRKANGHIRPATQTDCNFLINCLQALTQEALGETTDYDQAFQIIENCLKNQALYLWQDDVPVSVAGFTGATPNGIRVNFVYTPPQYRRQGYASSCVAALSQTLLDQGRKYCFLLTDLANPTSNHIYQAIGYQPVGDMHEYLFENGNLER